LDHKGHKEKKQLFLEKQLLLLLFVLFVPSL